MDSEKKKLILNKIENVEKNLNILRNDCKDINENIVLIKNLISDYLLVNKREETKKNNKGYFWGSY
jgi:hypothetical protein